MNIKVNLLLGGVILLNLLACQNDANSGDAAQHSASTEVNPTALFSPISATQSGVDFSNNIVENEEKNYFNFEYIYNGAGVALGDLNNDGLVDIFFSGNEVENKLYKNKGDFKFEDVTKFAAVKGSEWRSGVTMADVNNDGLLDIYVCRGGYKRDPAARKNLLYINRGDFRFKEQAAEFGLAESGYSIQSSFFDYDNDGDLDVYITNHPFEYDLPLNVRLDRRKNPGEQVRDKLYRNNGDNTFTEVAKESGIVNYGHGLGIVTADVNQDGWIDVYVANDYKEPDFLYLNQGDGTFKESIKDATGHVSFYAMGVDVADINNDGLEDILTTEMLPFDYKRSKTNMASMNVKLFRGMLALGLHHQYMHNSLQLNQGNGRFSEISQMTGLSKTDWSWACLMNDFDNDGQKDVFIANGYKRDVFDRDYKKNAKIKAEQQGGKLDLDQLYNIIPSTKIPNFIFKNEGNLTFSDKSKEWGISEAMLSMGGAVADLDNDGDLDLVLSNLDETAAIYKNNADKLGNNYLKIKFKGKNGNQLGLGTKVKIYTGDDIQYQEFKTTRGYQSSVEPVLHFGLGKTGTVDKIEVTWMDGKTEVLFNVTANQMLTVDYNNAKTTAAAEAVANPIFVDQTTSKITPPFVHKENNFDDYKIGVLREIFSKNFIEK